MTIMAIDPGPEESAYVEVTPNCDIKGGMGIVDYGIHPNSSIRAYLLAYCHTATEPRLVIEQIASMGMAVGAETFETCVWTGRFMEAFESQTGVGVVRIPRIPIKVHICGTAKAKDANVRQALIDRFGGKKALQKYKAAKLNRHGAVIVPAVKAGPLAGISSHCWAALAVAVVYVDRMKTCEFRVTGFGGSGVGKRQSQSPLMAEAMPPASLIFLVE
jgi:hypothetical protein